MSIPSKVIRVWSWRSKWHENAPKVGAADSCDLCMYKLFDYKENLNKSDHFFTFFHSHSRMILSILQYISTTDYF